MEVDNRTDLQQQAPRTEMPGAEPSYPQQSLPQQPITEDPKESKNKKKIVLIAILAVLILGGVGFLAYKMLHKPKSPEAVSLRAALTPQPQPSSKVTTNKAAPPDTTNWATFSNSQLHISFKYPQDSSKYQWRAYNGSENHELEEINSQNGVSLGVELLANKNIGQSYSVLNIIAKKTSITTSTDADIKTTAPSRQYPMTIDNVAGTCKERDVTNPDFVNQVGRVDISCRFDKGGISYLFAIGDDRLKPDRDYLNSKDIDLIEYGKAALNTVTFQ